jgi:hypothetical protein
VGSTSCSLAGTKLGPGEALQDYPVDFQQSGKVNVSDDCKLRYEPLPNWTREEMEAVIRRDEPAALALVPMVAGLEPPECAWAAEICIELTSHGEANVRANAILGLGYLARTCGELPESIIRPIIEKGMRDPDPWVQERSRDAADECSHFLKWSFSNC